MSNGRPTIGIIAGSGPDAGIDLWRKVLDNARSTLGATYRGDSDAPRVVVISEPALGASMDLPDTDPEVWAALESTARTLAGHCDLYAIACNTLNVYGPRLEALELDAHLVSFPAAVAEWVKRESIQHLGLLAARPVEALDRWSPYRELASVVAIERPPDADALHRLIEDVKADGGADPAHGDRLAQLVLTYAATDLLLACTELPLVAPDIEGRRLVDVTDLVAGELVRRWSIGGAG